MFFFVNRSGQFTEVLQTGVLRVYFPVFWAPGCDVFLSKVSFSVVHLLLFTYRTPIFSCCGGHPEVINTSIIFSFSFSLLKICVAIFMSQVFLRFVCVWEGVLLKQFFIVFPHGCSGIIGSNPDFCVINFFFFILCKTDVESDCSQPLFTMPC